MTSIRKGSLQEDSCHKVLTDLLLKLDFLMKGEGGGSHPIISLQYSSTVFLVARSVVSSISVSSLQPIVKPITEVLMDDGGPIGIKNGPQREDMAIELGEEKLSLLHQSKMSGRGRPDATPQ